MKFFDTNKLEKALLKETTIKYVIIRLFNAWEIIVISSLIRKYIEAF